MLVNSAGVTVFLVLVDSVLQLNTWLALVLSQLYTELRNIQGLVLMNLSISSYAM